MIEHAEITQLKDIFVTREECNTQMSVLHNEVVAENKEIAVINTKLTILIAILGTLGTAVVSALVGLVVKVLGG